MAEFVVSLAIKNIESKSKQGFTSRVGSEANALLPELENVNKLLVGANGSVKQSLSHELRRIAYEAEDEVDTLVSSASTFFYHVLKVRRTIKKLQNLKKQTCKVKGTLDQHSEGSSKEVVTHPVSSRVPRSHLPGDSDLVIGIDREITRVVDLLTQKFESDDCLELVNRLAIVGMGSSGKTTRAWRVYNDKAVKNHFHHQVWVLVSQGWDTSTVLHDIIKQIQIQMQSWWSWFFAKPDDNNQKKLDDEPNKLVSLLYKLLCKKSCLLIFDDVWDLQSLHEFSELIQGDRSDSPIFTIVITSRKRPSNHVNINWCIHQKQFLTDEDSWKLLRKIARKPHKDVSDEYRDLGKELLRKCEGLPSATLALGRVLKTKYSKSEWQGVLSQIDDGEGTAIYGPVKETLGLSYDHLPNHLKPCFLYLGRFPQGSEISAETLIRMWIAEGFIGCGSEETLEFAGRRYLQELIDHTMVNVVRKTYSGKVKAIHIHDIMRDLCILKAKEMDFLTLSSSEPDASGNTSR